MEIINRIKRLYGDNLSKELYKTQKKLNKLKAQNKKLKEKINHHENEIEYLNRIALRHLTNVNYNPIENNCCPYCGSKKYNIKTEYSINFLMECWRQQFNFVPFSPCYVDKILERRICCECGLNYYNYFIPDTEEFYSILSELYPIYEENKWDYNIAIKLIEEHHPKSLLDIGCGYGFFIEKAKNYMTDIRGSEFNPLAIEELHKKGIQVYDKDLNELSDTFDMITSFQVLEHVAKPKEFIENLLNLLNPGGLLLFVTPNPSSEFIKYAPSILELPPHHNLDISKEFYEYIAKKYDLDIISYIEQDMEFWVYQHYMKGKYNVSVNRDNDEDYKKFMNEKETLIGKSHAVLYQKK